MKMKKIVVASLLLGGFATGTLSSIDQHNDVQAATHKVSHKTKAHKKVKSSSKFYNVKDLGFLKTYTIYRVKAKSGVKAVGTATHHIPYGKYVKITGHSQLGYAMQDGSMIQHGKTGLQYIKKG